MTWRDEVEALIVAIDGAAARVAVELTAVDAWWRHVAPTTPLLADSRRPDGSRFRPDALPFATGTLPSAVLSFVAHDPGAVTRHMILRELRRALAPTGVLLVVDHNRPRRPLAAFAALVRSPRVPGRSPLARWRRLAYPAAREAHAAGFSVELMRLTTGERIQVIAARKRDDPGTGSRGGAPAT